MITNHPNRLPDFLIIGAAKSATSSLWNYTTSHPDVFFILKKEPNYFALNDALPAFTGPGDEETVNHNSVWDFNEYTRLFSGAKADQLVGEASTYYLYSKDAPENIKRLIPNVKMIAVLRNPVDRAISNFQHMRRDEREPYNDFARALKEEDERIANNWQHTWHYLNLGFYSQQLKRYFEIFPRDQIMIILFDDLKHDPNKVMKKVFAFLGLPEMTGKNFDNKTNVSGKPKSQRLQRFLTRRSWLKDITRPLMPKKLRFNLYNFLKNRNISDEKAFINPVDKETLRNIYKEEIETLEELIQIDLSQWKTIPESSQMNSN